MIKYIDTEAIDSYWPIVKCLISSALDHSCGELSTQDVYKRLHEETMGLLVVHDNGIKAACVVDFIDYPQITALRVVALSGSGMDEWLSDLLDFLDKWAVENNMSRIEQMGREGWVRKLKNFGYEKRYTFMTKELRDG